MEDFDAFSEVFGTRSEEPVRPLTDFGAVL
jgi:hypothetical protein